jgi:hypothetical protein
LTAHAALDAATDAASTPWDSQAEMFLIIFT